MAVHYLPHALERMTDRGATKDEVEMTLKAGRRSSAEYGRTKFERIFPYDGEWQGKPRKSKKVTVFAEPDGTGWLVITVITRYF